MQGNPKVLRVKGACHVHSTFSADGELSLAEVKELFVRDGFHFLAVCEHQHDVDQAKFQALVAECHRLSDSTCLIIPGIEFNCYRNHILGIGIRSYQPSVANDEVIPWIKDHGGFAVWAHPKKNLYQLPEHLVEQLDGIEIWNSKFDGKYAPRTDVIRYVEARQSRRPCLRPICSVDFHFRTQFRHVPVYCDVAELTTNQVVESLRTGQYVAGTPAFTVTGTGPVQARADALHRLVNTTNMWVFDRCKRIHRRMKRHRMGVPAVLKDFGRRLLS